MCLDGSCLGVGVAAACATEIEKGGQVALAAFIENASIT
jgi:hypothetical protein